MSKKKLIVSLVTILLISVVVVVAQNVVEIVNNISEQKLLKQMNNLKIEMSVSADLRANDLKNKINKYDFSELLRSLGYYEDEINEMVFKFIEIQSIYSLTENETKEFYELTKKGYDLNKLIEIFEFLVNTDYFRDMKFLKEIYDTSVEMKIISKYWVEIAFNQLTGRSDSALNQAQVANYVEDGISITEIYAANIMSRRGKKTIKTLLNEKKSGKEWIEIAEDIYPELSIDKKTNQKPDPASIVKAVMKSKITGVQPQAILKNSNEADKLIMNAQKSAEIAAASVGITPFELNENILEFAKEKLPSVEMEVLADWINSGHTVRSIETKFYESQKDGIPLEEKMNSLEVE